MFLFVEMMNNETNALRSVLTRISHQLSALWILELQGRNAGDSFTFFGR
jgi:hypothetical protein